MTPHRFPLRRLPNNQRPSPLSDVRSDTRLETTERAYSGRQAVVPVPTAPTPVSTTISDIILNTETDNTTSSSSSLNSISQREYEAAIEQLDKESWVDADAAHTTTYASGDTAPDGRLVLNLEEGIIEYRGLPGYTPPNFDVPHSVSSLFCSTTASSSTSSSNPASGEKRKGKLEVPPLGHSTTYMNSEGRMCLIQHVIISWPIKDY